MVEQWAQHYICAAHRSPTGVMHGHTWKVRATWSAIINVEDRKSALVDACAKRCHGVLEAGEGSAEGLAKAIGAELSADRVEVWREAEGLGAVWARS